MLDDWPFEGKLWWFILFFVVDGADDSTFVNWCWFFGWLMWWKFVCLVSKLSNKSIIVVWSCTIDDSIGYGRLIIFDWLHDLRQIDLSFSYFSVLCFLTFFLIFFEKREVARFGLTIWGDFKDILVGDFSKWMLVWIKYNSYFIFLDKEMCTEFRVGWIMKILSRTNEIYSPLYLGCDIL